ncbi:DUF1120 domain-containing protein [Klebsiella pasteurii]|uniref:DUF1120 domain-containing protein n=1 Tax=Klebsiella pasteurii TaxID=2587529 RepID=UPI00237B3BC3|nr:DUF1120 domain-containing protein [Klebsiella pasteurii]MDD9654957.1 DUF1120 domain-containing protein [Klebsiella pasteurii]
MKKTLLAAILAMSATATVSANPTAVLKLQGTLTNAACTPTLDNGGVVDYGTINLGELSATAVNQLGQKNINLTINCTAATKLSWNLVDERSSSNAKLTVENATASGGTLDDERVTYGVGKAGNVNIGSYALFVKSDSVVADGVGVNAISTDYYGSAETTWVKNPNGITAGSFRDFSVGAFGSSEPIAFKTATFPLVTSLAIQNTSTLAITDDTALDGQLTISLRYL